MTKNPHTKRDVVKAITTQYIDGAFVDSHGREVLKIADKLKLVPNS
jgi:hypothetical protein